MDVTLNAHEITPPLVFNQLVTSSCPLLLFNIWIAFMSIAELKAIQCMYTNYQCWSYNKFYYLQGRQLFCTFSVLSLKNPIICKTAFFVHCYNWRNKLWGGDKHLCLYFLQQETQICNNLFYCPKVLKNCTLYFKY